MAFSPNGITLLTGDDGEETSSGANGADGTLKLWNVQNGSLVRRFRGLEGTVDFVTFSPDGSVAISSDYATQGAIKLWNTRTGALIRVLGGNMGGGALVALVFSPDGRILVSSNAGEVKLWNVQAGTILKKISDQWAPLAYSNDGRFVAMSGGGSQDKHLVMLWDVAKAEFSRTLLESEDARSVAFSSNGRTLAVASSNGIALWNFRKGDLIAIIDSAQTDQILFSPDGSMLVSTSAETIKVWDLTGLR